MILSPCWSQRGFPLQQDTAAALSAGRRKQPPSPLHAPCKKCNSCYFPGRLCWLSCIAVLWGLCSAGWGPRPALCAHGEAVLQSVKAKEGTVFPPARWSQPVATAALELELIQKALSLQQQLFIKEKKNSPVFLPPPLYGSWQPVLPSSSCSLGWLSLSTGRHMGALYSQPTYNMVWPLLWRQQVAVLA